jgi:hypothetical protein
MIRSEVKFLLALLVAMIAVSGIVLGLVGLAVWVVGLMQ